VTVFPRHNSRRKRRDRGGTEQRDFFIVIDIITILASAPAPVATDKSVSQSVFLSMAAIHGETGRRTDKSNPVGALRASKYPIGEDGGWLTD